MYDMYVKHIFLYFFLACVIAFTILWNVGTGSTVLVQNLGGGYRRLYSLRYSCCWHKEIFFFTCINNFDNMEINYYICK